jgi:hypothetical protein
LQVLARKRTSAPHRGDFARPDVGDAAVLLVARALREAEGLADVNRPAADALEGARRDRRRRQDRAASTTPASPAAASSTTTTGEELSFFEWFDDRAEAGRTVLFISTHHTYSFGASGRCARSRSREPPLTVRRALVRSVLSEKGVRECGLHTLQCGGGEPAVPGARARHTASKLAGYTVK